MEKNYALAEHQYRLADQYSRTAEDEFDNNHPIFPNNIALLIMDEVMAGRREKRELYEAERLLVQAVDMNKGRNFFLAELNLARCHDLIARWKNEAS